MSKQQPNSRRIKRRVLIIGKRRRVVTVFIPEAPINVFLQEEPTFLALYWEQPGENVDGYRIYRRAFSDPYVLVAEVSNTTFDWADFAVEMGVGYAYYVTAFNSAGESPASEQVSGALLEEGA